MRKLFVTLLLLGTQCAVAGDIEYELIITKLDTNGYLLVEDGRRQDTNALQIGCDSRSEGIFYLTTKSGPYRRYSLQNYIKQTGINCYNILDNMKAIVDIDDIHIMYDAGTLAVKKITAVPKEKK
jgi:hypothetical protein